MSKLFTYKLPRSYRNWYDLYLRIKSAGLANELTVVIDDIGEGHIIPVDHINKMALQELDEAIPSINAFMNLKSASVQCEDGRQFHEEVSKMTPFVFAKDKNKK